MARTGVVVAVATLLIGSTGAGILAGGVLFAGAFWAYTAFDASRVTDSPDPVVAIAPIAPAAEAPVAAPVATPVAVVAPPTTAVATAPKARTASTGSSGPSTRAPRPAPKAVDPTDDLLADEDEWEAMGFDDAPSAAPATPAEEPDDDEDLDAILEDLDAEAKPMRRGR